MHLSAVFHSNGYPKALVRRVLSITPTSNTMDAETDDTEGPKLLCLPYIQGVSEKIERMSITWRTDSFQIWKQDETVVDEGEDTY